MQEAEYYQVIDIQTNFEVKGEVGNPYYLTMSAKLYNGNTQKEVYIPYDLMAEYMLSKDPQLTMYCRHNQLEGVQVIDFLQSLGAYNWENIIENYIYEHYKVFSDIVDISNPGGIDSSSNSNGGGDGEGGIPVM